MHIVASLLVPWPCHTEHIVRSNMLFSFRLRWRFSNDDRRRQEQGLVSSSKTLRNTLMTIDRVTATISILGNKSSYGRVRSVCWYLYADVGCWYAGRSKQLWWSFWTWREHTCNLSSTELVAVEGAGRHGWYLPVSRSSSPRHRRDGFPDVAQAWCYKQVYSTKPLD